jgi:protein-S-isoprenylcysteine O-methyltransferase
VTPLPLSNWIATTLVFGPPVADFLIEGRRFRGDRVRRRADPTYRGLVAWEVAALVLGMGLATTSWGRLPGNAWLWVGLGCATESLGIALRLWAIRTLGVHFTRYLDVSDAHRLVVHGPYRHLRHPSYAGAIVLYTGIGIGLGNVLSIVAFLALSTIGFVRRIPREEALLRRHLGRLYEDYARQTRRLLPGVW